MNTVIFAGAGFSRPFGFPVMATFFEEVEAGRYITDGEKELLRTLRMEANGGHSFVRGVRMDMEHILSYALMAMGADTQEEQQRVSRFDQLVRILAKVFTHAESRMECARKLYGGLKHLLHDGTPNKIGKLTVITTNYDLLWEWGLFEMGLRPRLPFVHAATNNSHHLYSTDAESPVLCKLHGSVNWFKRSNGEIEVDGQTTGGYVPDGPSPGNIQYPRVMASEYKWQSSPLVVPPTFYKMSPLPQLEQNWDYARKAIESATRLVFIGYSFPRSDTHMKYFLGAAISRAPRLQTVQLVDPRGREVFTNLQDAKEYGDHFLDMVRVLEKGWENRSLDEIMKAGKP